MLQSNDYNRSALKEAEERAKEQLGQQENRSTFITSKSKIQSQ